MNLRRYGTAVLLCASAVLLAVPPQEDEHPLTTAEAKKLKNPIPFTKKSIAQGRATFVRYCVACHGSDGKSQVDVIADATDLTAPKGYRNGVTDGEIYRSIRDGAGATMPRFKSQISSDEDIWRLVNYIHSLWPESMRPPLEDSKEKD